MEKYNCYVQKKEVTLSVTQSFILKCVNVLEIFVPVPTSAEMDGDRESRRPHLFHPIRCLELCCDPVGVVHPRCNSIPRGGLEL